MPNNHKEVKTDTLVECYTSTTDNFKFYLILLLKLKIITYWTSMKMIKVGILRYSDE